MNSHIDRQIIQIAVISMSFHLILLHDMCMHINNISIKQFRLILNLIKINTIFLPVAVVVAFFVCWAPFHAERMMTVSISAWTEPLLRIYRTLFYVSGIFYFINCTVNPVLYSVMSFKFRKGLRETILKSKCCRRPIKIRKRLPFSKFLHANSHTETAYTSMPPRFTNTAGRKLQETELIPQNEAQTSGSHSPAPSISGSSLKSTDGMSQEEDLQQVLLQINVIERQRRNDVTQTSTGKTREVEGLMEIKF